MQAVVLVLMVQDDGLILTFQVAGCMGEGPKKERDSHNLVTWTHLASREAGNVPLVLEGDMAS